MSIGERGPDSGGSDQTTEGNTRLEFEEFYKADIKSLVRFVYTLSGAVDRDSAADAAQEAMTLAWRHWETVRHPRAWVRKVAGRAWMKAHLIPEVAQDTIGERQGSLLLRPRRGDHSDLVATERSFQRGLAGLTITQRQIMAWAIDEYEPKEIAEILGMNPATVRSHLSQARAILNASLRIE